MWGPYCSTTGAWYGRSILLGIFAGPIEALPELSVTDLYFLHERGRFMSLYAFVLVGSNFLAPVIFGFINVGQSWQWVYYWAAIICAIALVMLFFFMEETNFDRHNSGTDSEHHVARVLEQSGRPAGTCNEAEVSNSTTTSATLEQSYHRKRSYVQRLKLVDKPRPFRMLSRIKLQLYFFLWPIPLYAGFAYGATTVWYSVLNATASPILSAAPYSFSSSIVGLFYLGPLVATLLALPATGVLSDWLMSRIARRKDGIAEPEQRLPLFALGTLATPLALLLWGVGSARGVAWPALLVAMGAIALQNACGAALSVNYLVDCYREMSGEALTAVICVRNTMVFAVSYGITPWIARMGRLDAFITAACVGTAASLAFVPMLVWGKQLRSRSAEVYWRVVEQSAAEGLGH